MRQRSAIKPNLTGREPIRVGIVGAGHIAYRVHLPILTHLPQARVTAICDEDAEAARQLANRFNIPRTYDSLAGMLEREPMDVVDLLTPPDSHASLALQVLRYGRHCILEKPLATTTSEADELIQASSETGLAVHVTHNFSFFPAIRKARAMVTSGILGEVIGVDVQYLTSVGAERYFSPDHWCHRMPGGIFYDVMPHLAMLVIEFLGDVSHVKVMTQKLSSHPHIPADELKALLACSRGLGSIHLSMNSPLTRYTVTITGTEAVLWVNADAQITVIHRPVRGYRTVGSPKDAIPRGLATLSEIGQQVAALAAASINVVAGRLNYLAGHRYLLEASLHSLCGNGDYPVTLHRCRQVVRVLETMFGPSV